MKIERNRSLVKDAQLQALFDAFASETSITQDCNLSFQTFSAMHEYDEILPDAFTVVPLLKRSAAIRLFRSALYQARKNGELTADALSTLAKQAYKAELSAAPQHFTFWTKIRMQGIQKGSGLSFKWAGVKMRVAAELPRRLKANDLGTMRSERIDPHYPPNAGYVILSCDERLARDAVDRMLDALRLVMSLLNLLETRGSRTIASGKNWTPGKLRMGEYQVLFRNGNLAKEDHLWYDPAYEKKAWYANVPHVSKFMEVYKPAKKVLSKLEKHPLKQILVSALSLTQDAFESKDGNHQLLRFWSALEKLYVKELGREPSNQKVIDRASFADEDYLITRWQLGHISRLRNEHVHARGHEDSFLEQSQYLRELLTRHIFHWIFHGRHYASHDELLAYVDLPRSNDALLAMRKRINKRIRMNKNRSE